MYKTYVIVALNLDNRKVLTPSFYCVSEYDARKSFRECYRHANYKILSVTEIPD